MAVLRLMGRGAPTQPSSLSPNRQSESPSGERDEAVSYEAEPPTATALQRFLAQW